MTEVQGSLAWTQPTGTLGRLVDEARARAALLQPHATRLQQQAEATLTASSFIDALTLPNVAIIAEVKRRSPSKGWINPALTAREQAAAYVAGGAAAISVLTEPEHFGGSAEDLRSTASSVPVPVLRKDFIVHPLQLLEAKTLGAAAALLIVRALSPDDLRLLIGTARGISLPVLVEVRDERELERALDCDARVIGINNRNLETLEIDPTTSERLLPLVPAGLLAVSESGVASRADVQRVGDAGADAVLVGSSVSAAGDPSAAVRALAGVRKSARAG